MAILSETLRNLIMTSIRGRRLGLDKDDYLVGQRDIRRQVTNATTATTATALSNYGIHTVVTTTNTVWTLASPVQGVPVKIVTGSSSTGLHAIVPTNATIVSSNGSAGSSITLAGPGAFIELVGDSTSRWIVSGIRSTTAGNTFVSVSS